MIFGLQDRLDNVKKRQIALLYADAEVLALAVRIVDQNFQLDILFQSLFQDILHEGHYIGMVGTECPPGIFGFQQVFRIEIHNGFFLSVGNVVDFFPQMQERGELGTNLIDAPEVDFGENGLLGLVRGGERSSVGIDDH